MTFIKGISKLNEDKVPVALYDMSILDVSERRSRRLEFDSITDAGRFLGHTSQTVGKRLRDGHYCYHRTTGNQYAIRKITTCQKES